MILDWIKTAEPGEQFVYYIGDLAHQRVGAEMPNSTVERAEPERREIEIEARAAYRLYEEGQVYLIQRKIKNYAYAYTAIKSSP